MKYYNRRTDAIMMPSTFRWNARTALNEREKEIMGYAPLVMKVVNKFNREDQRVGCFDKHDLIQSGFVGLIEGYDRIVKSDGKVNVNYLEINIKGTIDRHLNYQATGIAIPEYQLQKTKAEEVANRIINAFFYTFRLDDQAISGVTFNKFSARVEYTDALDAYENEELSQKLSDIMWQLTESQRTILNMSYGITIDKCTAKEIAIHMGLSEIAIKKNKARALDKLRTTDNYIYLEDFL